MPLLDASPGSHPTLELLRTDEPLACAVAGSGLGHFELDPASRAMRWSSELYRLFGVTPDGAVTAAQVRARLHADDAGARRSAFDHAMQSASGVYETSYRVVHADGSVRRLATRGQVVHEVGSDGTRRVVRIVGVVSDQTERLVIENELRDADLRRDQLLAMLGHELRNPLAPLNTAAELLRRAELAPERARSISAMIGRQVAQMSRLIDDVLDASRIGQGRISLSRERVDAAALTAQAVESERPAAERRGQLIELEVTQAPLWIDADPLRLLQIVGHLIQQASRSSARDDRIRVVAELQGRDIAISVVDQGAGIAAESLAQAFDLFVPAQPGASRARLGLELALVKGLTELHGGTVSAASEGKGRGSEFIVRLPAVS